jgi:protein-tyrosine phosphatase
MRGVECKPYWITPTLSIVPRPKGGSSLREEMVAMRTAGIDVVVSMLELPEARELGLDEEEIEARRAGMRFISFPVVDHGTPSDTEQFQRLLAALDKAIRAGKRIGIHCRACIGRSSILAASLLMRSGAGIDQAWQQVRNARGTSVPETPEQRLWVQNQIRQKPWHML